MSVSRLEYITKIGVEQMGDLADSLEDPNDGIEECVAEWQRRRDILIDELAGFSVIPPHGGWSFLVDVSPLGFDGPEASKRLLELGNIAATPMVNWGSENSRKYVRIVYSNEPVQRLKAVHWRQMVRDVVVVYDVKLEMEMNSAS